MKNTTVDDVGERGLILRLRDTFPELKFIGDDSAVLPRLECPVISTDSFFEGTHFHRWWAPAEVLGRRLLEAALSDIAAMGAGTRWIFAAVAIPAGLELDWIEGFYSGLLERTDTLIAGGETIRGKYFGITLTAVGEGGNPETLLRRSSLRPGDILWLSGPVGRALGAPEILEESGGLEGRDLHPVSGVISGDRLDQVRAFLLPHAELELAAILREKGVRCGIDISDGLLSEATHLAIESRVDVVLDIDESVFFNSVKDRPLEAAAAGEDYTLLFGAPERMNFSASGCSRIGYAKEGNGRLSILLNGKSVKADKIGYDHWEV